MSALHQSVSIVTSSVVGVAWPLRKLDAAADESITLCVCQYTGEARQRLAAVRLAPRADHVRDRREEDTLHE